MKLSKTELRLLLQGACLKSEEFKKKALKKEPTLEVMQDWIVLDDLIIRLQVILSEEEEEAWLLSSKTLKST